ncbi:MAG: ABC transporter permease [Fibrella sp.]|nr:ABC transporter permease [Armatimonadota bacterium]
MTLPPLLRFILLRLALAVPTLLAISFLVFFAAYLSPADPVDILLGQRAAPEAKARTRHEWGLDRPPRVRYADYVTKIVTKGDFGRSYQTREPITDIIKRGLPNTATLAIVSLIVSLVVGIPLGILAAVNANKWIDRAAMSLAMIGVAVPSFVLAPLLVLWLVVQKGMFSQSLSPIGFSLGEGRIDLKYFILPTLVLASRSSALIARLTRSAMLDVLAQDYIRTARAKGLSPAVVLFKHALKNAFPPVLTAAGTTFGYLLSGSFIVETFFTIPGIGYQSIRSILDRDYPVVQGLALLLATSFVLVNLLVDILYGVFDPRARVGEGTTKGTGEKKSAVATLAKGGA